MQKQLSDNSQLLEFYGHVNGLGVLLLAVISKSAVFPGSMYVQRYKYRKGYIKYAIILKIKGGFILTVFSGFRLR